MEIIKILAICFFAAVLAVIFKQYKHEYALLISVSASIIVILAVIKNIIGPIQLIKDKLDECGVQTGYFSVAFKALGIGYITAFVADTCRDSGQNSLASKAEFAGKCAIFILSVPLILTVMQTALGFM